MSDGVGSTHIGFRARLRGFGENYRPHVNSKIYIHHHKDLKP